MNTVDKVDQVKVTEKKKRGRPAKADKSTPLGDYIADQAAEARAKRTKDKIVESYYEMVGHKLLLCKKKVSGTTQRTFVGSVNDPKAGKEVREFVEKLKKENRVRARI